MWYFYPTNDRELLDRLSSVGIPATTIKIARPRELVGISFPEEMKERAFDILGIKPGETRIVLEPTNIDGIQIILLKSKYAVEPVSLKGKVYNWKEIEAILSEYARSASIDIKVFAPHGYANAPEKTGSLNIYFWSAPIATERKILNSAFGIKLPAGVSDALEPVNQGFVLRDQNDNALAEILPLNIYVLFDLTHGDFNQRGELLREILDKALPIALGPENEFKKRTEKEKQEALEKEKREFQENLPKYKEIYVRECAKRLSGKIEKLRKSVASHQKKVEELSSELVDQSRIIEESQQELRGLETISDDVFNKFGQEFEKLRNMEDIEEVEAKDGIISIFTKDLYFAADHSYNNHPAFSHEKGETFIGKYRIDIPTDGSPEIRFTHLTKRASRHPHIPEDKACFGNIVGAVAKYCAAYEFSVVAQLMIEYLKRS